MGVSQKDVAERLGVSVATVSRSLKGDPSIPPQTRGKVLATAARVGYRAKVGRSREPSAAGREKASASGIAAVLVDERAVDSSENTLRAIAGMSEAGHRLGMSLVVHFVGANRRVEVDRPEHQPEVMRAGRVQGVILVGSYPEEVVERLAESFTCVGLAHHHPGLPVDCIGPDNTDGIAAMIRHLHGLGHRSIGYVNANIETSVCRERLRGYVAGLFEAGLSRRDELVIRPKEYGFARDADLEVLRGWIDGGVTAVVCTNDTTAFMVYRWLRRNGYRCPEQVSITGFDGMTAPDDIAPLTTIRVRFEDEGRLAVERLVARLKDPTQAAMRVTVETQLIEGRTVRRL